MIDPRRSADPEGAHNDGTTQGTVCDDREPPQADLATVITARTQGSSSGDCMRPVPLQQVWVVVPGMMARCLTKPTMTIEWWLDSFANKVASCSVTAHRNVTGTQICGTYREVMSERMSSRRMRLPVSSGKSLGSGSNHRNLNRLLMSKGQTSEWMSG